MKPVENSKLTIHQQVQLLLPWYVNGTLLPDEKKLAESHLKTCLKCRAELVELQKISRFVCDADPFSSKAVSSFSELLDRIHESDSPTADPLEKTIHLQDFTPPDPTSKTKFSFAGYAVFAQAAIVLLAITWLIYFNDLNLSKRPVNQFHTLSSSSQSASMKNEIRVVFSKKANKAQIDETLLKLNGEIISGPSQQGVYVIRINGANISDQEISELVAKLRSYDHIIFAEPALPAFLQSLSG